MNHRQTRELPNEKEPFFKRHKVLTVVGALFICYLAYCILYNIAKPPVNSQTPAAIVREEITPAAIYNLVNDERQKAGVSRLSNNSLVAKAAQQKCDDMVANNYFEHVSPKTGKHGYQYAIDLIPHGTYFNENLTQGTSETNAKAVQSWIDSPPHRATMLEPRYTDTGVAVCKLPSEPENSRSVVQIFVELKPEQPKPTVIQQAPQRTSTYCSTQYYSSLNSASTRCF